MKKRAEELEKKDEELQYKLEEKDREWEQVLAIHRGQKCEPEHLTAASDGEMDAKQQTVQVHVEDFKLSENSLIQRNEEEIFESTLQQVKKLKEDKDPEINEIRPAVEDTVPVKLITEIKDFVLPLRVTINLKEECQESKKIKKRDYRH